MAQLKFYKSASAPASAATGAVWFDTTNHTIQVKTAAGWDKYAGALNDATWDGLNLTITKHDGSAIVLNFSDFASASGVTAALAGKLALGTNTDAAGTQSYHGLKADIAAAQAADKVLWEAADAALKTELQGYADTAVANKNVDAAGDNTLVNATAAGNKVTVAATAKLTNAVGLAESALQKEDISTGSANGTISIEGADVAVKGLGSAAYTEASAYDAAGAAGAVDTRLTQTIGTLDSTDAKTLEAINDELNAIDGEVSNIKNAIAGGVHFRGVFSEMPDADSYESGDIIIKIASDDPYTAFSEPTKEYILVVEDGVDPSDESTPIQVKRWVELGDLNPANERLTAIEESYVKSVATTDGDYVKLTPDVAANNAVVVAVDDSAIKTKFEEIERSIEGAVAGSVASVGGQAGTITIRGGQTAAGSVNLAMSGKEIQATLVGFDTKEDAGTAAGLIAELDAEVDGTGTNGVKVTVTEVDGKLTAVAVDDTAVATAATNAENNAKAYADSLLEWAEFN